MMPLFLLLALTALMAMEITKAQLVVITVTHTRHPSTCSNPQHPPFTTTVSISPSDWSSIVTHSTNDIFNTAGSTGRSYTSNDFLSSRETLLGSSAPSAVAETSNKPLISSGILSVSESRTGIITPDEPNGSPASTTIETSTIFVQPTPIDEYISAGGPFNLAFEIPIGFRRKGKRQTITPITLAYVKADGNTTTNRLLAVDLHLRNGELWAGSEKYSTQPEIDSQPFTAISPVGLITTNISTSFGRLFWNNTAFDGGAASFYREPPDQIENARIVIKFRGPSSLSWVPLDFVIDPSEPLSQDPVIILVLTFRISPSSYILYEI